MGDKEATKLETPEKSTIAFFSTYRPLVPLALYSYPMPPKPSSPTPPKPSSPIPPEQQEMVEINMTDTLTSYDYNGKVIPKESLKIILEKARDKLKDDDLDGIKLEELVAGFNSGRVSGLVFVSERQKGLELLHIALRFDATDPAQRWKSNCKTIVFPLSKFYDAFANVGVRMEDSGCFAGERGQYLIYVTTKDPPMKDNKIRRRQPWTAVYKLNLETGENERLTPQGEADLNPSVAPDGKRIAVASFQERPKGWHGEIENLQTNIFLMNVEEPINRAQIIVDGGWPTWGSNDVLFFHRQFRNEHFKQGADRKDLKCHDPYHWGVYRARLSSIIGPIGKGLILSPERFTDDPEIFKAITPAAIDEDTVVVATIRKSSMFSDIRGEEQYRHIEIFQKKEGIRTNIKLTQNVKSFDTSKGKEKITQVKEIYQKLADHYNPFVIKIEKERIRIGYHRSIIPETRPDLAQGKDEQELHDPGHFDIIESPDTEKIEVLRAPGVFPTFSKDGQRLAYVDNDFKHLWIMGDKITEPLLIYDQEHHEKDSEKKENIFSPVWSQGPQKILYVCRGTPFSADEPAEICAIDCEIVLSDPTKRDCQLITITKGFNNAFPSTNPDGTKMVFRSTRHFHKKGNVYKNLYIMDALPAKSEETRDMNTEPIMLPQDIEPGETDEYGVTRLTRGEHVDTHCEWSPNGELIVYSSSCSKPPGLPPFDNDLDPGHFAVFIVRVDNPNVVMKVIRSGEDLGGHVNHPFFSPDMKTIVVSADLAGVSCDPVSLPLFVHSVRPYGDIFTVDVNLDKKDQYVEDFKRITHSRYENSTASWTRDNKEKIAAWRDYLMHHVQEQSKVRRRKREVIRKPAFGIGCPYVGGGGGESWHMTGHLYLPKRQC